jgi:hypothetical protein
MAYGNSIMDPADCELLTFKYLTNFCMLLLTLWYVLVTQGVLLTLYVWVQSKIINVLPIMFRWLKLDLESP